MYGIILHFNLFNTIRLIFAEYFILLHLWDELFSVILQLYNIINNYVILLIILFPFHFIE